MPPIIFFTWGIVPIVVLALLVGRRWAVAITVVSVVGVAIVTMGLVALSGVGGSGGTPEPGGLTANEALTSGGLLFLVVLGLGLAVIRHEGRTRGY